MAEEIWKAVAGYEGLYEVSDLGRVRRIPSRIRKATLSANGYLHLVLSRFGHTRTHSVSRLVALAFIPNPLAKTTVNHKDGMKTNNCVANLEWATSSENTRHAIATGLIDKHLNAGASHGLAKLTEAQVIEIRQRRESEGLNHTRLAAEYGVCRTAISNIVSKRAWKFL